MPKYLVTVSVMGSGVLEVDAKRKADAEDKVLAMPIESVLESVSFDDSLDIVDVTKD